MSNPIIRGLEVVIEAGRRFAAGAESGLPVEGSDPRLLPGGILHAATHVDGGSDEIISALDPRAYPLYTSSLALRDPPTLANAGRMWWTTDEHILYVNTLSPAWVKIAVCDYADLVGIPSTFTPATHGDSSHDATVASLDGGAKVPTSELGSGSADSSKYLAGDQSWKDVSDLLPWLIDIDPFMTAISQTNWNSIWNDSNNVHGAQKESSAAQNDEICFDVVLAKGTWTVELMHNKYSDRGIYSVQFDTVEKGTIDGYSASQQYNVRSTVTGIAVSATAKVRLKLKMATKNGSSSNYRGSINWIQLRRTA